MATERILIVDDEETLCEVLKLNLENEGYDVDTALSAEEALQLDLKKYSLILLDIMMGEISGIKMAKMLKEDVTTAEIPIIFCTARDSEDDMVMGLNLGADDYIMKPYTIRNVLARVKSVLRRTSGHKATVKEDKPNVLKEGGLQLDLEFRRCLIDGEEVKIASARNKEHTAVVEEHLYRVSFVPGEGGLDQTLSAGIRMRAAGKDMARSETSEGVASYVVGPFSDKRQAEELADFIKSMGVSEVSVDIIGNTTLNK